MIRVLGIVGSPRIKGNTERLVSEALKAAAKEGAETELVRLAGKEIKPCNACLACEKTGKCSIKDDLQPIFDKMVQADGILIGSPVYTGAASAQTKALIDRSSYLAFVKGRLFENKVGGPIVVGRRGGQNFTFAELLFFFFISGIIVPGCTYWNIGFGLEKGEVEKDEEGLRTASNFGKRMVWLIKAIKAKS